MKKTIFSLLLLISFSAFATDEVKTLINNTTEGVSTVYNDSKSVIDSAYQDSKSIIKTIHDDLKDVSPVLYQDGKELLHKVAEVLGTTANQVWAILIKQQVVWAICGLIFMISSIFIIKTVLKKMSNDYIVAKVIIIVALIIGNSIQLPKTVTGFVNPEYGAIKELYMYYNKFNQ